MYDSGAAIGIIGFLAMIWFVVGLINMGIGVYSWWDHTGWEEPNKPDPQAQIKDIQKQKVKYTKNNAKFKTTVKFTDGFYFVTHRTNRENHFMSYQISVDAEEILRLALEAHSKAVEKKLAKQSKQKLPAHGAATETIEENPPKDEEVVKQEKEKSAVPPVTETTVPAEPVLPPRQPSGNAVITVVGGPMAGRQFRCRPGTAVVAGRDGGRCHLVLNQYSSVSGVHCRIEIRPQKILATDLQSTNGTYAKGLRLPADQQVDLGDNAVIQLGNEDGRIEIHFE